MHRNILLLGSKSESRKRLLRDAGIEFKIVDQRADESMCDWRVPLIELVESIAVHKMEHVIMPVGQEDDCYFVLTADTLGIDSKGNICAKPIDKQDAISKLKSYRFGAETCTAFCLDKKIFKEGSWFVEKRIVNYASGQYIFNVPDDWIERYFELSIKAGIEYTKVSGAVAIEEFGAQFLQHIDGSYTAVVGLPMYELREALIKISFFN